MVAAQPYLGDIVKPAVFINLLRIDVGMFSRFGSKRYDEDGNLILREQDFEL